MSAFAMGGMGDISLRIIRTIILNNPIGLFIRAILAKWSLVVVLPSVLVAYWVLMGLQSAGVLDKAFATISRGLLETKAVAQNCTPKILDFKALWACLEHPGVYVEHPQESALHQRLRALERPEEMQDYLAAHPRDPYSEL